MPGFKVLIVGAGLGGLTLAQSLRAAGTEVRVF
ncbi:NAD(P)-binding protein [Lichenifustis flavocetrariae]|uniref:NAD(P)-binding protein n=1 Tax=Lichenifustis flavocetrariae TaxID=2949735 RepID=A0AA42CMP2_9HYPH|nr:NAD(P)-binding protein [Lichenifustis flavocetrariae]MCW6512738.1 NAD(P)-binding protein [Lichenifustis flavocetrariae]